MKKIFKFLLPFTVVASLLIGVQVFALLGPGSGGNILTPTLWQRTGTNTINTMSSSDELGDATTRISKIYTNNLDSNYLTVNTLTIHALVNKRIKIFGGDQLRPTLHIDDMVRVYELMLTAPRELIHGQAFNVAYQNKSIKDIAEIVRETLDEQITCEIISTDDKRSYHVISDKIKRVLGFEPSSTIADAILSLKQAYDKGLIKDGLTNPFYYNVQQMKKINLK